MQVIEVAGGSSLSGQVKASGFKHAFPPLFSLALSSGGSCLINNVPDVTDVKILGKIGQMLGASVLYQPEKRSMHIDPRTLHSACIPADLSALIHGAWYLAPGLLARFGYVKLGETGGCKIGDGKAGGRPVEQLCAVLQRFGATVTATGTHVEATLQRCFRGARLNLADFAMREAVTGNLTGPLYSGATKAALLCAARAEGVSEIIHPYAKPDVMALVEGIKRQHIPVNWERDRIIIKGNPCAVGFETVIGPDLIEVMTYLTLSACCNAPVSITGLSRSTLEAGLASEIACLNRLGYRLKWQDQEVSIHRTSPASRLDIQVVSHGIFSDSQPFIALLLMASKQGGSITEQVWVNRFQYIRELEKMGAKVTHGNARVEISPGLPCKSDLTVNAVDLRGAAALVIAALRIQGKTKVSGLSHLERGYSDFLGQLRLLGAKL